jgi:hypothetical protein
MLDHGNGDREPCNARFAEAVSLRSDAGVEVEAGVIDDDWRSLWAPRRPPYLQ